MPPTGDRTRRFEHLALPHLDAAYNLARWLAGDPAEAQDLVQETFLRALRYFDSYQGGDIRVWLFTILRNCFVTARRSARLTYAADPTEDDADAPREPLWSTPVRDPEMLLAAQRDGERLNALLRRLPSDYREVLLLREVEDLSYRDIAAITGVPVGTVMSRLARARARLRQHWFAARENADEV